MFSFCSVYCGKTEFTSLGYKTNPTVEECPNNFENKYPKVASSNMSCLEAHAGFLDCL